MSDEVSAKPRVRMAKDERRRQLVGIGLRMLTQRPIQEVSLDSVAQEAGISRGLVFHYFPTKTAFYEAVIAAAGRRIVRTTRPDDDASPALAVRQVISRFIAQIERRRAVYLALVQGQLSDVGGSEVAGTLRENITRTVVDALAGGGVVAPAAVVHGWLAYVEDRAIAWSAPSAAGDGGAVPSNSALTLDALVHHCEHALAALLVVSAEVAEPLTSEVLTPEAPISALDSTVFDLVKEMRHALSSGHSS